LNRKDDKYYMNIALQQAKIAGKEGEVPVGAVLLLKDGREFAAHNAPISLNDSTAHAEMCTIRTACKVAENYRLVGSTLYVTLEPCAMCAGAIIHARIGRVVYGARDAKTGTVESLYQLLSDTRLNHQPEISGGVMERECRTILRDFFHRQRRAI